MDGLTIMQHYPTENENYMSRVQNMINAYYENGSSDVGVDTPADDVDRLSKHLSTFPKCINEYVDKLLVEELSVGLPQDDIDDLSKKHNQKCIDAIDAARNAILSIEKYASMVGTPHLFTKNDILDLSNDKVLELIVNVVIDMYAEERVSADEYIRNLVSVREKLDNTLLSLDYE